MASFFLLHISGSLSQTPVFPILTIHFIKLSRCRPIVRMKFGHFYCHSVGTFHWNWEGWFKILYCKNETSLLVAVSMYFSVYVLLVLEFASCHLSISFTKWQPLSVSQKSFDFAVVPTYLYHMFYLSSQSTEKWGLEMENCAIKIDWLKLRSPPIWDGDMNSSHFLPTKLRPLIGLPAGSANCRGLVFSGE